MSKPPSSPIPARLHVLLAQDALYGVVIRRGPSKQVCTIGWNRADDTFTLGQWLKGRIYERRCDLSPDGRHMIYFAMNGQWNSEVNGSWTALSRAQFTGDSNPATNINARAVGNRFQLATGGETVNTDTKLREFMNCVPKGLELPESLVWLWRGYDPAKTSQEFTPDPAEKDKPLWRVVSLNRD